MSVLVDFSIFPMGKGESVSPYVAKAVEIISSSGLSYSLGPMGTAIEGEWDQIMDVVTRCYRELEKDTDRIYMTLKVDARKGEEGMLSRKVESVTGKM